MQNSNKSNPKDDNSSFFDRLASLYKDLGWKSSIDLDKPLLFSRRRRRLEKVLAQANKTIEKSQKFINKIESAKLSSINNTKSVPNNATIRKEYIRCGKQFCEQPHGPYYYAYWKDTDGGNKKLKKKYIGTYLPTKDKAELLENYDNNNTSSS